MKRIFSLIYLCVALLCRADEVTDFYAGPAAVKARVDSLMAATADPSKLLEQADSLYFTPGSPSECEALYALYLQAAIPRLEGTDRQVAQWKLNDVCLRNAEGSPAANFEFALASGPKRVKLHKFMKGKPMLMLLYDPECHHCQEVISELDSANIAAKLPILAVCIESTPELWELSRSGLPQGWISAYDRSCISENDIYMLRSLPSIYLLDGQKNVILKNPPLQRLLQWISPL